MDESERTGALSELRSCAPTGVQSVPFILPAGQGNARFLRKKFSQSSQVCAKWRRFELSVHELHRRRRCDWSTQTKTKRRQGTRPVVQARSASSSYDVPPFASLTLIAYTWTSAPPPLLDSSRKTYDLLCSHQDCAGGA
eukprot:1915088-Pleurochrysis_carterae.AAC.3